MPLKKKIRTAILAVWTIIGFGIILSVALCDNLGLSQTVITIITKVYSISTFPVGIVVYILSRK